MTSKRYYLKNGFGNWSWENDIRKNLSMLTKTITNLDAIFIKLLEHDIISYEEMETIQKESVTGSKQNLKLLYTLKSKDWHRVRSLFLQLLRETTNGHCADVIEASSDNQPSTSTKRTNTENENSSKKNDLSKPLNKKWWPEEKILPDAFYKRKSENYELFTEKLKRLLNKNRSNTTVITQKVAVSGLGGIGKSTTAKWYGKQFEEDYDFILWIDCGEGSLLKSFTSLARILKVEDRRKLELKKLTAACFQLLKDNKCLFIYDNAESYVGIKGIRDTLPKSYSKFHVIITSRNREWGHEGGHGLIPEFQLDVFDKNEAMEFMTRNLEINSDNDESKLESLCELLGNLPLALQIAAATLKKNKISLIDYIDDIKDSEHIIVTKFDDYEKTINKTIHISLKLIRDDERNVGVLAYRILIYFGYLTPDDVDLNFFRSVENQTNHSQLYEATQLLESYSLIAYNILQGELLSNNEGYKPDQHLCSIHRLLQQVIRHHSTESKNEILKQILNCKGFLQYKLIPFSYADEELQNEFPQLKAELIYKLELNKLLKERKFREALELSRLIKDALNKLTSRFNYGVCLKLNSDERKSMEVFESLFYELIENVNNAPKDESYYEEYFNQFGIVHGRNKEVNLEVILGQILFADTYKEKASELFLVVKQAILPISTPLYEIVAFLNSMSFSNYQLRYMGGEHYISLSMKNEDHAKKFEWSSCAVDKNFPLPKDLEELTLREAKFLDGKIKWNVPKLNLIQTDFLKNTPEITVQEMTIVKSKVDIYLLPQSLQKLKLQDCISVKNPVTVVRNISPLPHLQNFELKYSKGIRGMKLEDFDVSYLLSQSLIKLRLKCYGLSFVDPCNCALYVPLNCLKLMKAIHLEGCNLIVPRDVIPIAPQNLTLRNVHIKDEDNKYHSSQLVNNFINFNNMQTLDLEGMSIDLSDDVTIDQVRLSAMSQVLNWETSKWKINQFHLEKFHDFSKTEIRVKQMTIRNSEVVQISHLPQTLEKLILWGKTSIYCPTSSDGNNLPSCWPSCLQQLEIKSVVVFLDVYGNELEERNTSAILPHSLNQLKIDCINSATRLLVGLNYLQSIDVLQLNNCDLICFPAPAIRIAPKELLLRNVNIIDGHTNTKIDIPLNDFIDFNQMQKLELWGHIVDFCESLKIEYVKLKQSKLLNWENGRWIIEILSISPDPGPTTNIINKQTNINRRFLLGLDSDIDYVSDSDIDFGPDTDIDFGPDSDIDFVPDSDIDFGPDSDIDYAPDSDIDYGPYSDIDDVPDSDIDYGPESDIDNVPESDIDFGQDSDIDFGQVSDIDFGQDSDIDYRPESDIDDAPDSDIGDMPDYDIDDTPDFDTNDVAESVANDVADSDIENGPDSYIDDAPDSDIDGMPDFDIDNGPDSDIDYASDFNFNDVRDSE